MPETDKERLQYNNLELQDVTRYVEDLPEYQLGLQIFNQTAEPSTYNGIWIKSNSYEYEAIKETNSRDSLEASTINIVKGNSHSTKIIDTNVTGNLTYSFSKILITDDNTDICYDIEVYYGDGTQWVNITPTLYTKLEYIQSSRTQYIDTGINYSNTMRVIIDFQDASSNRWDCLLGDGQANLKIQNSGGNGYDIQGCGTGQSISVVDYGGYTARMTFDFNKWDFYINNTLVYTDSNQTVFTGGSINIFRYTEGAGLGAMKLYSFKIYDDDILIGDFIPVKDENDVVCLYDKVSATYFYNLGTGTFVAGPELN